MNSPKYRPSQMKRIFPGEQEQNLRDKQKIEALIKGLNAKLQNDEGLCKKAAAILSEWVNSKKR